MEEGKDGGEAWFRKKSEEKWDGDSIDLMQKGEKANATKANATEDAGAYKPQCFFVDVG